MYSLLSLSTDSPVGISLAHTASNNYVMLQLCTEFHNLLLTLAHFHIYLWCKEQVKK